MDYCTVCQLRRPTSHVYYNTCGNCKLSIQWRTTHVHSFSQPSCCTACLWGYWELPADIHDEVLVSEDLDLKCKLNFVQWLNKSLWYNCKSRNCKFCIVLTVGYASLVYARMKLLTDLCVEIALLLKCLDIYCVYVPSRVCVT